MTGFWWWGQKKEWSPLRIIVHYIGYHTVNISAVLYLKKSYFSLVHGVTTLALKSNAPNLWHCNKFLWSKKKQENSNILFLVAISILGMVLNSLNLISYVNYFVTCIEFFKFSSCEINIISMEFVHCMIMFLYNLLPTSQKNIDIVCNFSFSTYDLGTKYSE